MTSALNPKSIVFFIAFVPQLIGTDWALLPQVVLLEVTLVTLAAANAALWAVLAGELRARFESPRLLWSTELAAAS